MNGAKIRKQGARELVNKKIGDYDRMNVVFFDVDGVLNSEKFLCDKQGEFINPKNVANLKMIVDATQAKLVMTSDWRKQVIDKDVSKAHVRELIGRLADAGLEVYGATPSGDELRNKYGSYTRACAVKEYVTANSVEGYVILDDMDMDWETYGLDPHWINTENVLVGLTEADARNAVSIING